MKSRSYGIHLDNNYHIIWIPYSSNKKSLKGEAFALLKEVVFKFFILEVSVWWIINYRKIKFTS
jgi:hypothetical protein